MKIAFLTPEYPHQSTGSSGGIGTSIKNLAEALTQLGHQVHILVYAQNQDKVFKDKGMTFHQIQNRKLKGFSWWLTRKKIEKYIDDLYAKKQIDILEAPDWTGITSFISPRKCPIVIRLNGSDTYFCHIENRKVKWINRFHEKRALKQADAHISVSEFTAEQTNSIFGLNINFKIIPNSINIENFQPELAVEKNSIKQILYIGTLIRKKGVLELPHIFNQVVKKFPNVELILIGSDASDIKTQSVSTYNLMKPLFDEKAIKKQHYTGKVPYEDVKHYLQQADIVVFPSFAEALPLSWLEAMAMQKIIVASDIGWANEIVQHELNGFLVHPKNHTLYAEYILNILNEEVDINQIGKNARNRILTIFNSKLVAQQSVEFYTTVVKMN